jgi:poly-gamma-glutamate synthesis protein (capsule biosynthesis protein)
LTAALAALAMSAGAPLVRASETPAPAPAPAASSGAGRAGHMRGSFTLVSVGDLINARPIVDDPDPAVRRLIDVLKDGDVAIGNQESIFFDLNTFNGYGPGSPYILLGRPELAAGLKAMGIDMVSTANNHASDWGIQGLIAMDRLLDRAGVVHAGDGASLGEARGPRFWDTPRGRVALVATASTYKQGAKAQDALEGVPARPGISGLRTREINIVTPATMAHLRAAAGRSGETGDLVTMISAPFAQSIEKVYRVGPASGVSYEMNTYDRAAILDAIRAGKQAADLTVFTIHAHENADDMDDLKPGAPPDFLVALSHSAIDAGADVVMGGGPHSLRGIEIYRGKPIFYGMGVFLFGGNVVLTQEQRTEKYGADGAAKTDTSNPKDAAFRQPESWNDGFIAATTFRDGVLETIRLYPLDHSATTSQGGTTTHLASPDRARAILRTLQGLSAGFGASIAIEGAVGVIHPCSSGRNRSSPMTGETPTRSAPGSTSKAGLA